MIIIPKSMHQDSAPLHWFALKVFFNKVGLVETYLSQAGVECFVPYEQKTYIRGGRKKKVTVPVLSLAFFCGTEHFARRLQLALRGKVKVYSQQTATGWMPVPISEREFRVFQLVVSSGAEGLEYFADDAHCFCQGERVRVTDGPFKGAEGYVKRIKGNRRLIVSVHGVCAVATTYIPQCFLVKADS